MHVTSDQGGGGAKEGNQIPHQEIVGSPKRVLSLPPLIPDFHLNLYNAPQSVLAQMLSSPKFKSKYVQCIPCRCEKQNKYVCMQVKDTKVNDDK